MIDRGGGRRHGRVGHRRRARRRADRRRADRGHRRPRRRCRCRTPWSTSTPPASGCCPAWSMSTCTCGSPATSTRRTSAPATAAAAAGGVTTVFGMPNLNPVTKNLQVLEELFDLYDTKSIVDWNHNPVPSVLGEVQPMADAGVAAFKIYMVVDTGRDYPHPSGTGIHDHGHLLRHVRGHQPHRAAVHDPSPRPGHHGRHRADPLGPGRPQPGRLRPDAGHPQRPDLGRGHRGDPADGRGHRHQAPHRPHADRGGRSSWCAGPRSGACR